MKKKLSIFALLLVMSMAVTSCAQTGSSSAAATSASEVSASSDASSAEEKSLYPVEGDVTLNILMESDANVQSAGYKDQSETELYKYWQEKTGINLDFNIVADDSAMLLSLAGGTYPDVFMMYASNYTGGLNAMIQDDLAINLMDYADDMPDYYNLVQSVPDYKRYVTSDDGGIYFFANLIEEGNPTLSWRGMVVREDMLNKVNMEVPTTNSEFKAMLKAFKDQLGCDAPLCCNWWGYMLDDGFFTTEYGLVSAAGYQVDGTYHYGAYEEEYRDAIGYLKDLYDEGLFDVNFQTTDEATSQASLLNGETGAHYTSCARINTIWQKATDEDFDLVGIGSLNAEDGTKAYFSQCDSLTPSRFNGYVTADCKNPEAAVALFNWLYTEEGNLTANFGVQGLCWDYVDGEPAFNDYMAKNENGLSLDNMLYVQTMINRPCLYLGSVAVQRFSMQEQIDAMNAWQDSDVTTYALPSYTVTDADLQTEAANLWTDINTYIKEYRNYFITGQKNLDSDFDDYIAGLKKMGMDRYIEIQQQALSAYLNK